VSRVDSVAGEWRAIGPIIWAEHQLGWIMEDGKPITLTDWQRAALAAWWELRGSTSTLAISNVKKTGKTTLDAILLAWRWLALPGQHFVCANDFDQSQGLQFRMIAQMVERHPFLSQHVVATRSKLTFEPTGSELEALSVDAAGSAGALHLTSSHTEAWGIQYEQSIRAWEELTPQPGVFYGFPALRIVDSYAGYEGESDTWHNLVDRGLAGDRVSEEWPVYRNGALLLFHVAGLEAQERCFRGDKSEQEAYYEDQRASLRSGTFRRLHLNERTSSEGAFVEAADWDALVLDWFKCPTPGASVSLIVGVDLATKHDTAAAVSVFSVPDEESSLCGLGPYRIWWPRGEELDLSAVEDWLAQLAKDFHVQSIRFDPYQGTYLMQRLAAEGLPVEEFPQTVANLTMAGNALYDVIKQRRLAVYEGAESIRRHVLAAAAKETERGIRLVKGYGGRKIDAGIALAMAVSAAELQDSGPWAYLM